MGETFSNDLINNTIYHLLNFEKHGSFQAAAREAAINNNFQFVLLSDDFNPVFTVETRHMKTVDEVVRKGIEKGIDGRFTSIDVEGILTYWGPVKIDGKKYYLMLVDNENSYSQEDIKRLAEILELAMGMWKYSPIRDVTAEFVKALRRGNKGLANTLKEEAEFSNKNIKAVLYVGGLEKEAGFKVISKFEKQTGLRILKIADGNEISAVILENKNSLPEEQNWNYLCDYLLDSGAKEVFYFNGIDSVEGAADAFQQINETWPFIHYIFPHKNVFTKYELALASNCIHISLKGGMVKKYYIDLLTPFKKIGESKRNQLLETLEIYILDADMKASTTAKIMSIHTNTVQYRLKKIKEILGIDIMGTTVIPGLIIALALERIENIVKVL